MLREVKKSNIIQLLGDALAGDEDSAVVIGLVEFLCLHAPSALFVDEDKQGVEEFESIQEFLDEYSTSE